MKFTIDTFEHCVPRFLDIEIYINGLGIYHKHILTGQYVHIHSYILWRCKTSLIRSLVIRAKKICSANCLNTEIQSYAACNGYPQNVVNGIIKHALCNNDNNNTCNDNAKDTVSVFDQIKYSEEALNV